MKYLLILGMLLTYNVQAEWKDTGQYDTYAGKKEYRQAKARQRADAHPQGSGIGTNKYIIEYDKDYKVDAYSRNCCDIYND